MKGLLVQSLAACARRGVAGVDVVAGDGTKVKANAPVAAGVTAERWEIEIGELEALLAAGAETWFARAQAADAAAGARFGDGDADGGPAGGGTMTMARLTGKIVGRQKATARLDAGAAGRQAQAAAEHPEKITRLEARASARRADAGRLAAETDARVAGYQRRAAAKAAAGRRNRPGGRVPVPADRHIVVRRARQALAAAEQKLAAARAAAAPPPKPPKASPAGPASRVMRANKGGFDQLRNVPVLAGKHQVIYAIATHDNPTGRGAVHPLLREGRAHLDAAGIPGPTGKALFDAGYASEDNFTTACEPELSAAITKEARQTGRLRDGHKPATMKDSWQQMAARLDAPEGKALHRQRAGIIDPGFAQLSARLGRNLPYRDTKADLELHLWAASHNLLKAIAPQPAAPPPAPPPSSPRPAEHPATPAPRTRGHTPTVPKQQPHSQRRP